MLKKLKSTKIGRICIYVPSLLPATWVYSCHSSFGLKGAPSENLLQMMMKKSLMRRSPTKFHEPKFLISPKLKNIAKPN